MKVAVGFGRGKAFIPKVNGEAEGFAERLGKGLGFGGLGAEVSRHIEGVAEDDGGAAISAKQAPERLQILFEVLAEEGEDGLGGEAEFVRDGNADAAVAEVEAEEAFHQTIVAKGPVATVRSA